MSEKCYSIGGEDYELDLDGVIQDYVDNVCIEGNTGEVIEVYESDVKQYKASDFYNCTHMIISEMQDAAYEEGGEYTERWLDKIKPEDNKILHDMISRAIDHWADNCGYHPRFFNAENARIIKVRILDEEGYYEIVKGEKEE